MQPPASLFDLFLVSWLRPLNDAWPAKPAAARPAAEEREAVQRWEDEGGNTR